MTYSARTQKAMQVRRANPFQQFGQSGDAYTVGGATGCTHTVLQYLALVWTGRRYTQDEISKMVGYPDQRDIPPRYRRGLFPSEVQRACGRLGLPYQVWDGQNGRPDAPSAHGLLQLTERGPVGFGHAYSHWPEWRGFTYFGVKADGYPNGYAGPLGRAGRTQLSGFTGAHFGVVLGWDPDAPSSSRRVAAWEPNHNSPSRPEDPAYDLITSHQFRVVYESYNRVLKRSLYALVPTRSLPL